MPYLAPPMLKALRDSCVHTVLDLGCGNGSCSALLHSRGFAVTGCDMSTSGIAFAQRAHPNINFFEHDISRPLPAKFTGHYDAVVSLEVVEHLLQPRHSGGKCLQGASAGRYVSHEHSFSRILEKSRAGDH